MNKTLIIFFAIALFLRIYTLLISIKNERMLKKDGAIEYGKFNTIVLSALHIVFYFSSFLWGFLQGVQFDNVTIIGMTLYVFSVVVIFYIMYLLKNLWTVKLLIAKRHKLNKSWIFKYFRHPNYLLGIIPELVGITLIFKSWMVFIFTFPIYVILLSVRIVQEEKIMKQRFLNY